MRSPFPDGARVRDNFGEPRGDGARVHRGIDVYLPVGRPIVAPESGVILGTGSTERAGLWLAMRGANYRWSFSHLGSTLGTRGDRVREGQRIATAGATGIERSQPHVHLELERGAVDPYPLLEELQMGTVSKSSSDWAQESEAARRGAYAQAQRRADSSGKVIATILPALGDAERAEAEQAFDNIAEMYVNASMAMNGSPAEQGIGVMGMQVVAERMQRLQAQVRDQAQPGVMDTIREGSRQLAASGSSFRDTGLLLLGVGTLLYASTQGGRS